MGSAKLTTFRTADPALGDPIMKAQDIKPKTWYAYRPSGHGGTSPLLVLGTDRYSEAGYREARMMYASPRAPLTTGQARWGYRRENRITGYLAVQLSGLAATVVKSYAETGANEDDAKKIMVDAADLLDRTIANVAARGEVPVSEINAEENRGCGTTVILVQGREIEGDYFELAKIRHEQEQEAKRSREAAQQATAQRREKMIAVLTEARDMGLNTDPFKGGAVDDRGAWKRYSRIRMSLETYAQMVAEIAHLRRVVAGKNQEA